MNELVSRVDWLRAEIIGRGFRVADFGNETTAAVVDRTVGGVVLVPLSPRLVLMRCSQVAMLKGVVSVRTDLLEPVLYPAKRYELSYYRNELIHIFLDEGFGGIGILSAHAH